MVTSPSHNHLGRACHYPSWQRMHSSAVCASCAMSSYSARGTLHPYHISPFTHWSLTVTFTLTLLAVLIPLQLPANILQDWV